MSFSIIPRTVFKTKSKISGEIVVKEQLSQYTLHVQGMIQSGGVTKGVWKKALKRVTSHESRVTRVLVLGLGGGTAVQLIKSQYPEAKIVGIEIDPEIVKISKKYFGLGEIQNLEIITADAVKLLRENDSSLFTNHYSLILVDLYLGDKFPPKAASDEFLKNLKKILSKNGVIIFNQLKNKEEKRFVEKLKGNFSNIDKLETPTNLFFLVH